VQSEIDQIQEDMDAASGRMAYLGHSAAYSTLNLRFFQVLDAQARETSSPSFIREVRDSIVEGWSWLGKLMLELLTIWPLWVAGFLFWRSFRKRQIKKKAVVVAKE